LEEVKLAYEAGAVDVQARSRSAPIGTAVSRSGSTRPSAGRSSTLALPAELNKYYNDTMGRKQLRMVVADCYRMFKDPFETARVVNDIKKVGFEFSTRGGMSIAVDDVVMSSTKGDLLEKADEAADKLDRQYRRGLVTDDERLRELEVIWNDARDQLSKDVERNLGGQNSVFMMADSARRET
jgi:DNA-directed RNA polymerase subunit beta'